MTLGIVKISSYVTSKLPIINKNLLCDNTIICRQILLYLVNKHQCNMFTMCSFINKLFTVAGNNNTKCSKNSIGNRKFLSKLQSLFFKLNQSA